MKTNEQKFFSYGNYLTTDEMISYSGGAYNLWRLIGYAFGVNYAIHKEHAENAPWVGQGSK